MSRDFIGSKISIITKSQCRYSGTIIGIDAQTSSIVLGNCRSFGTESRSGGLGNGHAAGTVLPIVQFANSDIEDLKIVEEEQQKTSESVPQQQKQSYSMSAISSPPQRASIHDDPAIVSAVVSSTNKDNQLNGGMTNRLLQNLQHMTLNDEHQSKSDESRLHSSSGEHASPWSLLSSSKLEQHSKPPNANILGQKSKFFDDFMLEKTNNNFNRPNNYSRSSNTHSTQTARENGGNQYDHNDLPVRQPFFSNDRPQRQHQQQQPPPQQQQQQQQYREQNGYNQRQFYNQRRPPMSNHQQRRPGGFGGGNRETFQDNPNDYDADFDFETNNMKFNKLTGEEDLKPVLDLPNPIQSNPDSSPLYDKKKSFFDNLAVTDASDGQAPYSNNRSKNQDTFGYNGYQRQNNRSNGYGYRRNNYNNNNNNNYRQQYGDEDFHYRQQNNNNNAYRYRY